MSEGRLDHKQARLQHGSTPDTCVSRPSQQTHYKSGRESRPP